MDGVFLDNLSDAGNMILNILWDRNREMGADELSEAVKEVYQRNLEPRVIRKNANLLVRQGYVQRRRHGVKVYYIALGAEEVR